jgi:hypothetical protein
MTPLKHMYLSRAAYAGEASKVFDISLCFRKKNNGSAMIGEKDETGR